MRKSLLIMFCLIVSFPRVLAAEAGSGGSGDADVIRSIVYNWRDAWISKDITRYLSFYSRSFRSGSIGYDEWVRRKRAILQRTDFIDLELSSMNIKLNSRRNASVVFHQKYTNDRMTDTGRKQLIFEKLDSGWKIISETWEELITDAASNEKVVVKSIRFDLGKDGTEKIFIRFSRQYVPEIIALEGAKPRIALDIKPIAGWEGSKTIPTHGELVRQIRTHLHSKAETLRIVLDLDPDRNYHVNPTYYRSENIYFLEIGDAGAKINGVPIKSRQ